MSSVLLKEMEMLVRSEFKNIRPKGLKFKDLPNAYPSYEKWSHIVFGSIKKSNDVSAHPEIQTVFSHKLDWHSQYVTEYRERLIEKNELNGFVRIGQLDEFEDSIRDDALLVLSDREGFCGVIAGIKSPIYGLPAIYMIESFLSQRWTGKKIAPLAHAQFLNAISNRFEYVWGSIYDKNLSSLKTANRIGRKIIETEYFVPFVD